MDTDHAIPADLGALRAEFGRTSQSGLVGRVAHRAAAEPWFDAA
ncbi:hypothetical protein ACWGH4_31230 [Streptomyces sp. NPDC054847]